MESLAFLPTEQLGAEAQVSNETASKIGATVFELLAKPMEAHDPTLMPGTWTLTPTIWATGYPPRQTVDQDREPDND